MTIDSTIDVQDFVFYAFNQSVSVTSCGLEDWPGL